MHLLIRVRTIYLSDVSPILNYVDEPPSLNFLLSISTDLGLVYPGIFILAVVLLLFSAIVSASESAFLSITEDRLEQFRKSAKEQTVVALLDQRHLLLATIKLFSAIARIGLVTIIALILLAESPTILSVGLAIVYVTFATALCVEAIPKIYAKRSALPFARLTSGVWRILVLICKPIVIHFIDLKSVENNEYDEQGTVSDELNDALVQATEKEVTTHKETDILMSIANFGKLTVSQVMRTRVEISAIDSLSSFTSLMNCVDKCGFSRIPVYRNTIDTIEGILYIKDLLPFLDRPENFQWQSLIRPGFFVRENKKINSLLKDFQEKRVHMAIVVDDYGKTIGLVTLEDLIEEIIGEINDEFDDVETFKKKREGETIVFDGKTSLQDFCAALEIDQRMLGGVSREVKTLSDFIFSLKQGISKTGDQINYEQLTFIVESADTKGIKKVRVSVHEQA